MINVLFEKERLYHSSKIEIDGLRIKARFDDYEYFKENVERLLSDGIFEYLQSDFSPLVDKYADEIERGFPKEFADENVNICELAANIEGDIKNVSCILDNEYRNKDEVEANLMVVITVSNSMFFMDIDAIARAFCYLANGVEMVDDWVNNITINTYTKDGYALV